MSTTMTTLEHSSIPPIPQDDFSLKHKIKEKTKDVFRKVVPSHDTKEQPDVISSQIDNDPAFNTSKFLKRPHEGPTGIRAKTLEALKTSAVAIAHPRAMAKQRATKTTAGKLVHSYPYMSQQADLDFLDAHDELQQAQLEAEGLEDDCSDQERVDCGHTHTERQKRVDEMEERRKSMRVAWITTRHVRRVRAVDTEPPPFPPNDYFEGVDDCGYPTFNWIKWIGHRLLHGSHSFSAQYIDESDVLPFDEIALRRLIERLIVVSAPLQTFILEVRCVYRWDDPVKTGQLLVLYLILWYVSHIMTFMYFFIIYSTVMNYYHPTSLGELRSSTKRTVDRGSKAFKVEEMMNRHGSDGWLGELMDQAGPQAQVQLSDFLSMIEACSNFYQFRSPRQTVNTLILFTACLVVTAMTDTKSMLKITWLLAGGLFFLCWPISSLHPRYRFLVSPWKWALWNIPDHPEWCFMYLQERGNTAKEKMKNEMALQSSQHIGTQSEITHLGVDTSLDNMQPTDMTETQVSLEGREISRFFCTYQTTPGYLVITTDGIHFMPMVKHIVSGESFHKLYSDIFELSKRQTKSNILSPIVNVTHSLDKLDIRFKNQATPHGRTIEDHPELVVLENMKGRDKAFNTIIAFSGVRWQHLRRKAADYQQAKNDIICGINS